MRFALLAIVAIAGCKARQAEVTGSVRYRNKPLTSGSVSFYCANGEIRSSIISEDGTYHLAKMAPGSVRVTVASHPRVPQSLRASWGPTRVGPSGAREPEAPEKPLVQVPKRYNQPESSELAFEVQPGEQKLDLELRP